MAEMWKQRQVHALGPLVWDGLWMQVPATSLSTCMTLGKFLHPPSIGFLMCRVQMIKTALLGCGVTSMREEDKCE